MSLMEIQLAAMCAVALAGVLMSAFTLFRSSKAIHAFEELSREQGRQFAAEIEPLKSAIETMAGEIRELQQQPSFSGAALPKQTLNLTKRSQALRMNRRGDGPEQIAAALEMPLQEVDLLLKVHRIVVNNA